MGKIDTSNDNLCKLAVAFDLGDHVIGDTPARVMLVLGKGEWNLRATIGPMNVWGLNLDGVWKYKGWAGFRTPRDAVDAFNRSLDNPKWDKGPDPDKDNKDW